MNITTAYNDIYIYNEYNDLECLLKKLRSVICSTLSANYTRTSRREGRPKNNPACIQVQVTLRHVT